MDQFLPRQQVSALESVSLLADVPESIDDDVRFSDRDFAILRIERNLDIRKGSANQEGCPP